MNLQAVLRSAAQVTALHHLASDLLPILGAREQNSGANKGSSMRLGSERQDPRYQGTSALQRLEAARDPSFHPRTLQMTHEISCRVCCRERTRYLRNASFGTVEETAAKRLCRHSELQEINVQNPARDSKPRCSLARVLCPVVAVLAGDVHADLGATGVV